MARKFLENAGIDIDSTIDISLEKDEHRRKIFEEEKEEYGFASNELWNLDRTMMYLLYERLTMYVEKGYDSTDDTTCVVNGQEEKLSYWVRRIIELCESVFKNDKILYDNDESYEKQYAIWTIWREIYPVMWV